jgi:hypothetical protein
MPHKVKALLLHAKAKKARRHQKPLLIPNLKKIVAYRELLNVDRAVALKDLKTIYRNEMKQCHPDRFHGDDAALAIAQHRSQQVIEAYHFLVSVNPETINGLLPEFRETTAREALVDFSYEAARLKVHFSNGLAYEFISVPKPVYIKMINADSPGRFAKRHIYGEFPWRKIAEAG